MRFLTVVLVALAAFGHIQPGHADAAPLPRLAVSRDGRYLTTADGRPFFLLADTAWEIIHRLDRAEVATYLDARKAQGYNTILAVALPELSIAKEPNAYGDFPLVDKDPLNPAISPGEDPSDATAYDFWDHADHIVEAANARGLYVGLLPSWGRWVNDEKDRIFDVPKARAWGRFIGTRYGSKGVFWVLGGDRPPKGFEAIWRAMAEGLASAAKTPVVMTFHPGAPTSSTTFHGDRWLSFNATYSGHGKPQDVKPWKLVEADYARKPVKPVIDLEPIYEDIPFGIATYEHGYSSARDVRRAAYWDVFSGACGAVYGNQATWQMWAPKHTRIYGPLMPWRDALAREGAAQLQHLRALIESRPFAARVPDQALLADNADDILHQTATRGPGYVFVYSPQGRPMHVELGRLAARRLTTWWFDPRTGRSEPGETFDNPRVRRTFTCPTEGDGADWVLVIDDESQRFPPPGARRD